jgi:hypothetical protein
MKVEFFLKNKIQKRIRWTRRGHNIHSIIAGWRGDTAMVDAAPGETRRGGGQAGKAGRQVDREG